MGLKTATLMISVLLLLSAVNAYYNVTYLNTTMIMKANSSAYIIETYNLYVSNSSMQQYIQSRNSVNLSLTGWEKILNTLELTFHIVSKHHSPYDFTFLPGPLVSQFGGGGTASLTMSYYINNITTIKNVAPRKFTYTFNSSVFNFLDTISGEALPNNTRFNIIIPDGSQEYTIYPQPDLPLPSPRDVYTNVTEFSWFSEEPLSQFNFSFVTTESMQQEVFNFFSNFYIAYKEDIYIVAVIAIVAAIAYLYLRSGMSGQHKHD